MRFPQVRIGQRFAYQGRQYTKTGPLTASEEGTGSQRMIMRAAEVTLLEASGDDAARPYKQRYKRAEVERVLRGFRRALSERVAAAAGSDGRLTLEQVLQLIERTEADY
jgi:hypothetical protein